MRWTSRAPGPRTILLTWRVACAVSFVTYSILCHGLYGRTLGKLLFGVVVRDVSESPLSLRQAVLRDIVPLVSAPLSLAVEIPYVLRGIDPDGAERWAETMPGLLNWMGVLNWIGLLWFCTELVTMLTNRKRRALHDFIAGSVVVRRDALGP